MAGRKKGSSSLGHHQGATPPLQEEIKRWEAQLKGLEVEWRVAGAITYPAADADGSRGGTLNVQWRGQPCIRTTIGRKRPPAENSTRGVKRPQRYQPGTVALHDIHWSQQSTELYICKWPFACLVCEIAQGYGIHNFCFQIYVVQALQETAKYYLMGLLDDAILCAIHAKLVTIMPKDIYLVCHICGEQKMLSLFLYVVGCVWVTSMWEGGMTEKQRDF